MSSTATPITAPQPQLDLSGDLDMIFELHPKAWAPRVDVYAQALVTAIETGSALPSTQAVYAALRLRGFKETKRDGVYGFRGVRSVYSQDVVQRHHNNPNSPIEPTPWLQPNDWAHRTN